LSKTDLEFKKNIREILENGNWDENPRPIYEDGYAANTKFIAQVYEKYDLDKDEFPITSLRPINWVNAIKELLWIYSDQTSNLNVLENKYDIHWWNSWSIDGDGTIGQRYGATVRQYDLINRLIEGLKDAPFSRRHILNLWQEQDFKETSGLLPCAFQSSYTVRKIEGEYYLDATLFCRSSDYLVSGHINMIQYVALQMMLAHECGFKVGKFVRFTQNLHIYNRHFDNAYEMLDRNPEHQNPVLKLNAEGKSFYEITVDDFEMINYNPIKPQLKFDLGI